MDKRFRKRISDISNTIKNQDILNEDILELVIGLQVLKWNDDKYYFDEEDARKFIRFSKRIEKYFKGY